MAHLSGAAASFAQLADQYLDGIQKTILRPVNLARLAIETGHRASSNVAIVKSKDEMEQTLLNSFEPLEKKGRALAKKA
jgi:hypothetical protein